MSYWNLSKNGIIPQQYAKLSYRYSLRDPKTGLFWNGKRTNTVLTSKPHYWIKKSAAISAYNGYIRYLSSLVKETDRPMHFELIEEKISYEFSKTVLTKLDFTSVALGELEKFCKNKVVKSFIKHRINFKKSIADVEAIMLIDRNQKIPMSDDIDVLYEYYNERVTVIYNANEAIVLKINCNPNKIYYLSDFWNDFEKKYPGMREANRKILEIG